MLRDVDERGPAWHYHSTDGRGLVTPPMTVVRIAAQNDGWNAAAAARRSQLILYASHATSLTRRRREECPDQELRRMVQRDLSRPVVQSSVTDEDGETFCNQGVICKNWPGGVRLLW